MFQLFVGYIEFLKFEGDQPFIRAELFLTYASK